MKREVADHREELLAVELELDHRVLPELAPQDRGHLLGRRRRSAWRADPCRTRRRARARSAKAARLALAGGDAGLGLERGHAGRWHDDDVPLDPLSARHRAVCAPSSSVAGRRTRGCAGRAAVRRGDALLSRPQAKSELTLSELWMRLIASPRRRAIESCLIFGQLFAASDSGDRVASRRPRLSGDSAMRCTAGPESTPCVAHATTLRAPLSARARAAPAERAGRVDDVVDDDAVLALDLADEVHDLAHVRALAALVDDGERRARAASSRRACARRPRHPARRRPPTSRIASCR